MWSPSLSRLGVRLAVNWKLVTEFVCLLLCNSWFPGMCLSIRNASRNRVASPSLLIHFAGFSFGKIR